MASNVVLYPTVVFEASSKHRIEKSKGVSICFGTQPSDKDLLSEAKSKILELEQENEKLEYHSQCFNVLDQKFNEQKSKLNKMKMLSFKVLNQLAKYLENKDTSTLVDTMATLVDSLVQSNDGMTQKMACINKGIGEMSKDQIAAIMSDV